MPHASPPAVPPSPQAVAIVPARTVARARRIARDSQRYGWSYQTRVESSAYGAFSPRRPGRRATPCSNSREPGFDERGPRSVAGRGHDTACPSDRSGEASRFGMPSPSGRTRRAAASTSFRVDRRPAERAPRQPRRRRGQARAYRRRRVGSPSCCTPEGASRRRVQQRRSRLPPSCWISRPETAKH